MSRCTCHKPRPAVEAKTAEQRADVALGRWRDVVRCESCGMFGTVTNGRAKGGGRKTVWFRHPGATERYAAELASYCKAIGL